MQPTAFPETIVADQPDSEYLLRDYVSTFPVPEWVPLNSTKTCFHCTNTLKSGKKHNCRLCGHVYCSQCTNKYHLPEKYEQKDKSGPTRVCYGCKLTCLRMRQAALGLPLDSSTRPLFPPRWQPMVSYVACNKCCIKRSSPHNCRGCGLLYCNDCSSKLPIELPDEFNRKDKSGPQRFCDGCRYRLFSGARLDDGTNMHVYEQLFQEQLRRVRDFESQIDAVQNPITINSTGPINTNTIPSIIAQERSKSLEGNDNIRIIYANNPNIPTQTIEMKSDDAKNPDDFIPQQQKQRNIAKQPSSVSAELSQVLGQLNIDNSKTPQNTSANNTNTNTNTNTNANVIHLSKLAPNNTSNATAPTGSNTTSLANAISPDSNTSQGCSTPKSPHHRTIARSQRYQQIKQSGGSSRQSISNNQTTFRRTDSVSFNFTPEQHDENDEVPPPPPPPPEESDEEITRNTPRVETTCASSSSSSNNVQQQTIQPIITGPSQSRRPAGAKDIYRTMSIIRDTPLPLTSQTNTSDDCKDDEYDNSRTAKAITSHEKLVKPSQLFAKNNKPKPAYLLEEEAIPKLNQGK